MRTRSRVPWPRTARLRCRTSKSLPGLSEGVWGVDVTPHIPLLKIRGTRAKLERARTKLSLPERTKADWPLTRGAFFCPSEDASRRFPGPQRRGTGGARTRTRMNADLRVAFVFGLASRGIFLIPKYSKQRGRYPRNPELVRTGVACVPSLFRSARDLSRWLKPRLFWAADCRG